MSEYILVYRGFARTAGRCRVVVASDDRGDKAVLLGDLEDNPGTTVMSAIEQVAQDVQRESLNGDSHFKLYQYVLKGLPELSPTFYRIEWRGQSGRFSMPTWERVDPATDRWLRYLRDKVKDSGYTSEALIAERQLAVVDAREREDLPAAS
jgi:hypothetical protein